MEKGKQEGYPNLVDKDGGVKFPNQARSRAGKYKGLNNSLKEIFNSDGFIRIPIEDVESFCGVKSKSLIEALKDVPGFDPKFGILLKVTNGYAAALRVQRFTRSKNANTALKAIEFVADRTEGRPRQEVINKTEFTNELPINANVKGLDKDLMKKVSEVFRNLHKNGNE